MTMRPLIDLTEPSPGIFLVRLQSPPVNAWTDAFVAAMQDIVIRLARTSARVVVITGEEGRFSAGGDFHRFQTITDEATARAFVVRVQRLVSDVAAIPAPVIAAVNGPALGGGARTGAGLRYPGRGRTGDSRPS